MISRANALRPTPYADASPRSLCCDWSPMREKWDCPKGLTRMPPACRRRRPPTAPCNAGLDWKAVRSASRCPGFALSVICRASRAASENGTWPAGRLPDASGRTWNGAALPRNVVGWPRNMLAYEYR